MSPATLICAHALHGSIWEASMDDLREKMEVSEPLMQQAIDALRRYPPKRSSVYAWKPKRGVNGS